MNTPDKANEPLKIIENKFAKAFFQNSVPMAITTMKDGRYSDVSDAFLDLMGLLRHEVIGNTSTGIGFITPEQRSIVLNEIEKKGRVENLELQVRTKAGELRYGLFNSTRITIEGEEHLLTVVTDITDQNQAQEALKASEAKYRRLHDTMRDAFVCVDMEGTINEFNEAYWKMLGYEPHELLTLTYKDLTPEKWHALEDIIVEKQIIPFGYSDPYEKEYLRKDGTVIPVELRTILIRDDAGAPKSMWAIVRDITERKRAEYALRESEAKYRFMTEKMYDIIWTAGLDFQLTYDSPSVERVLGYTPQERMGQKASEMLTPESYAHALEVMSAELMHDQDEGVDPDRTIKLELEYYHKNGSTVWMECIVSAIRDRAGKISGIHGVSRDITDRRQVETELKKHRDQLEGLINERTVELTRAYESLKLENEARKAGESALRSREIELEKGRRDLEEMNAALKVLLKQREGDKASMEMNIISNIKTSVLPYIEKLELSGLAEGQMRVSSLIKSLLGEITSPFIKKISSEFLGFTPNEIQVASLVKEGKSSKEIAEILNISLNTVHTYRYKIRIKTGLKNNKVNLRSYLQTLG